MTLTFIETRAFERDRDAHFIDDEGFRAFQNFLLDDPMAGDVIQGTGGIRKVRWADQRRGKGKRHPGTEAADQRNGGWAASRANRRFTRKLTMANRKTSTDNEQASTRLFDDLVAGFDDLREYARGQRELRVTTMRSASPSAEPVTALVIPRSLYEELVRAANASQTTPADWIAARLPSYQPGEAADAAQ